MPQRKTQCGSRRNRPIADHGDVVRQAKVKLAGTRTEPLACFPIENPGPLAKYAHFGYSIIVPVAQTGKSPGAPKLNWRSPHPSPYCPSRGTIRSFGTRPRDHAATIPKAGDRHVTQDPEIQHAVVRISGSGPLGIDEPLTVSEYGIIAAGKLGRAGKRKSDWPSPGRA